MFLKFSTKSWEKNANFAGTNWSSPLIGGLIIKNVHREVNMRETCRGSLWEHLRMKEKDRIEKDEKAARTRCSFLFVLLLLWLLIPLNRVIEQKAHPHHPGNQILDQLLQIQNPSSTFCTRTQSFLHFHSCHNHTSNILLPEVERRVHYLGPCNTGSSIRRTWMAKVI